MHNITKHITPLGNYDVPTGWPMKPYKRPYGGTPGPPVMYEKQATQKIRGQATATPTPSVFKKKTFA